MRKRLEDIEDHIERRFYLKERNQIEEAIENHDYNWVANLRTIQLLIDNLRNINAVRNSESQVWKLFGALKDLQFFRGWEMNHVIVAFSGAVIRKVNKGGSLDRTYKMKNAQFENIGRPGEYRNKHKIMILLRGSVRVGEKKEIKQATDGRPVLEQDCFPKFENGVYKNVYFELMDGEYLSPQVFQFFRVKNRDIEVKDQKLNVDFLENSYVLEIPLVGKVNEYIYKYKNYDMFVKIDYLVRHPAFSLFQFESLVLLSRSTHLQPCRYGDIIMKNGEESKFIHIVRKGNVSVSLIQIFRTF